MTTSKEKLVKIHFKSSELDYEATVEPSIAAQIIAKLATENLIIYEVDRHGS